MLLTKYLMTMKKLILLLLASSVVPITYGQTIKTPTNSNVSYSYEEEMSQEQIEIYDAYWQNEIEENEWDAEIIGSSSAQYNCHSYAWHVSDEGNLVWINSPDPYYSGGSPTYVSSTNTEDSLRKIVYDYEYGGGHSAISTNTENYVVSKWGCGPLVRHAMYDWPWIGESQPEGADYYEIDIDGDDDVNIGGTASETTINISGATYSWSGDDYYVCGSGSTYVGTVTGLKTTSGYPLGDVKVEITSSYSNTTVKGDRKNYITVYPWTTEPTISASGGSRLVCSSGLAFYVNNAPAGSTIEWTCGSYLSRVSAQGSNPCTFSSTGDGSSWVNAIVHPSTCGGIQLSQYNVWSGKPVLNVSGPDEGYIYNTYTFYANPGTYSSPTDYDWVLNPLYNNVVHDYGSYADIDFYDAYEGYQVVCRAKNTCSSGAWGDWSLTNIDIYEGEKFLLSPNPASESVTISLKQISLPEMKVEELNSIYSVKIVDIYGNLLYSTVKSGSSFAIPVSNLADGNYFVQVINGKKISILKLVVKH